MRAVTITAIRAAAWFCLAAGLVTATARATDPQHSADPQRSADPQQTGDPYQIMAEVTTQLFAALERQPRAARHNVDKIRSLVDQLLSPHFDSEYAARLVLGTHWRTATSDQREQFATALYRRLLHTYADAVTEWTPDRFKLLPLLADPAALRVTVRALITNSHGEIVPVDFRMHLIADGWKIFDVTVDGVSYVRNYHDDTDAEVIQKGLNAAITRLQSTDPGAIGRASPANAGAR
jgi:phospholipid transport system substrate-binding protein